MLRSASRSWCRLGVACLSCRLLARLGVVPRLWSVRLSAVRALSGCSALRKWSGASQGGVRCLVNGCLLDGDEVLRRRVEEWDGCHSCVNLSIASPKGQECLNCETC